MLIYYFGSLEDSSVQMVYRFSTTGAGEAVRKYTNLRIARNFRDINEARPLRYRLRAHVRDMMMAILSFPPRADSIGSWIRFPFYHHVFDDERKAFDRQLKYLKNRGDIISLHDAISIFEGREKISEHYFCITFDDGFKNCLTNALPILVENNCQATFFVATDYIGCDLHQDQKIVQNFFLRSSYPSQILIEFMDWNDCRTLINSGMTCGAHTCSHVPLSMLTIEEATQELIISKQTIERELGVECLYFSSPWGIPGKDFDIHIHPILSQKIRIPCVSHYRKRCQLWHSRPVDD